MSKRSFDTSSVKTKMTFYEQVTLSYIGFPDITVNTQVHFTFLPSNGMGNFRP